MVALTCSRISVKGGCTIEKYFFVSPYSSAYEDEPWFLDADEMKDRRKDDARIVKKWDKLEALLDVGFKYKR